MDVRQLFDIKGKVAVVTGASVGLGNQIARGLAEAGANLVLCARKKERTDVLAEEIRRETGVKVLSCQCDVSREEDVIRLAQESLTNFGTVDILVNNAGITWGAKPEEMSAGDWQRVLDVNLNGTFFGCKHFGKAMIARRSGCMINLSSALAFKDDTIVMGAPSYIASKGAVISLTRHLAVQWAEYGIRVNAMAPGWFPSPMTRSTIKKHAEDMLARIPMRRFGGDDDLKGLVVFLSSAASSFITGQTIVIDGGQGLV
jgi:NAD(P)-dependent dehydrogenase (short-subunit alcohol dehydrogenase family)